VSKRIAAHQPSLYQNLPKECQWQAYHLELLALVSFPCATSTCRHADVQAAYTTVTVVIFIIHVNPILFKVIITVCFKVAINMMV
jgi:hypothetical protein